MEDKKIIFIFFAVVFLFSGYMLHAQTSLSASQPGYYVDKSSGQSVFKQRLVWEKEEYALNYEVVIEIFSGQYIECYNEITERTFIEISLHPGRYRYSVTPYDLLGRRCDASEWEEFTVNTAYQPEIVKVVPDFFYMDQRQERVLIISGNNILADSVIYLRNGERNLIPINKTVTNNSTVRLTFDDDTLVPGTYEIYINNPGGLDTSLGGFFIGYHKQFELFLIAGFSPVIPAIGDLSEIFGSNISSGLTFRLEALSSERASFKGGWELAASFYNLENNPFNLNADKYFALPYPYAKLSLFDLSLNISLQGRFNHQRTLVTFYVGFGFTNYTPLGFDEPLGFDYVSPPGFDPYNYDENNDNNNFKEGDVHINFGVSSLFLVYKIFYIETGVELTYYLKVKSFLIKPRIGLVIRI
jgi:hypothetical protein